MSTPMDAIRQCRLVVREYERELKDARDHVKDWRADLKAAQARLNSLLDDEAAGVQELPLGDPDANGQPLTADAATDAPADHEGDEPVFVGEFSLNEVPERDGWDLVTSQPMTDDARTEADALAKIEADARSTARAAKPKRRNRKSKSHA